MQGTRNAIAYFASVQRSTVIGGPEGKYPAATAGTIRLLSNKLWQVIVASLIAACTRLGCSTHATAHTLASPAVTQWNAPITKDIRV